MTREEAIWVRDRLAELARPVPLTGLGIAPGNGIHLSRSVEAPWTWEMWTIDEDGHKRRVASRLSSPSSLIAAVCRAARRSGGKTVAACPDLEAIATCMALDNLDAWLIEGDRAAEARLILDGERPPGPSDPIVSMRMSWIGSTRAESADARFAALPNDC